MKRIGFISLFLVSSAAWSSLPTDDCHNLAAREVFVQGTSMQPLLKDRETSKVLFGAAHCLELAHGDVVLFQRAPSDRPMLKTLVGLPGDKVALRPGGKLDINDVAQRNAHAQEYLITRRQWLMLEKGLTGSGEVREGHYLTLGENTRDSMDSRAFGPVYFYQIKGKLSR